MSYWKNTVLLVAGIIVALSGILLFVAVADYDYRYAIDTTLDRPPQGVTDILPYDGLSNQQKEIFAKAVSGETLHFEEETMPLVVERDGTYYVSKAPRYFDWTNPRTFGPVLIFVSGVFVVVQAIRRDISS